MPSTLKKQGTRNGTGDSKESTDNHGESEEDPEESGSVDAVAYQSVQDHAEPAGDHKKPKEDPEESSENSREIAATARRSRGLRRQYRSANAQLPQPAHAFPPA